MLALNRKLLRDLWSVKEQALAIGAVIGCGVATFVMSLMTLSSLQLTKDIYYDRYRFADVFAHVKRAPMSLVPRIEEIPGVARVQTRVVMDVTLDVPGMSEPAVGRLISIPETPGAELNSLYLRRGRYIRPHHADEVLVSDGFAQAHGLEPGDHVPAVINGRLRDLEIVGIALSPEYIYQIPAGDAFPDDKRFAIFWMGREPLEAAFDMDGAFNDVCIKLLPGASEPEVIRRLDRLLDPFGALGAIGREDQVSNRFISDEIKQLRGMAIVAPTIFLSVAGFLLNVVLTRIVGAQREQIAVIKAFGYTNRDVGLHYLKLTLSIVFIGFLVGTGFGAWLGRGLTSMYARFYRFPVLTFHFDPAVVFWALAVSGGAAVIGTLGAVRKAVLLPPAEAMRPEPPATYRLTLFERLGLAALLSQPARMILRHLERQPVKAGMSVLGIAMAVAVLILGNFSSDALDYIMDVQYQFAQREDITVTFVEPRPARTVHELERLPGVIDVETFRAVPARLRYEQNSRRVGVMGIEPDARMHRLINEKIEPVTLPPEGIVLARKLAELLGVREGQTITLESLEGTRVVRRVPVAMLVEEFIGAGAYMDISALQRLLREGQTISGGFMQADAAHSEDLYTTLKRSPAVASATVREAALRNFQETIAENLLRMRFFNVLFAGVIAAGVVYNSARIALAERSRELASLRVLGFTRAEISSILLGELAVLTVAALPLGMLMGYLFVAYAVTTLDTDLYRIPLVIDASTYGMAVLIVVVAAAISGLIVRRKLDHLDLIAVLKTRE